MVGKQSFLALGMVAAGQNATGANVRSTHETFGASGGLVGRGTRRPVYLKFFMARLVAEAPRKPASAQMARLITQKMPKV